ncbi:MAG: tyrosine-type recombinase/integrase [Akkermansiaceae bacterium]
MDRLSKNSRTVNGVQIEDKLYSVQIQHAGKRTWFQLHTANKRDAGRKARDIFLSLKSIGMEATLEKYKPSKAEKITSPTIGDIINAYLRVSKVQSAQTYINALRLIVAGAMEIEKDHTRYDHANGGNAAWRATVDAVKLADITQTAIDQWIKRFVDKKTADDYTKQRSAMVSVNSFLTNACSIFGKKVIGSMREQLELPEEIVFKQITKFTRQQIKPKPYKSVFDVEELIGQARKKLIGIEQDQQWLIFLLSVSSGLRRDEIDKLIWSQIDFRKHRISLEETKYWKPKGTIGDVNLDPQLSHLIKAYKKKSDSEFVIQSDVAPRFQTKSRHYRAEKHFEALISWLRANGLAEAKKPIHTLRKEAGSRINKLYGLAAAQKFLRHADVSTTASYYVSTDDKLTTGFGGLLTGKDDK